MNAPIPPPFPLKPLALTDAQRIAIAWLLHRAADEFSNHGCNDFPELATLMPAKELTAMAEALCNDDADLIDLRYRMKKGGVEQHGVMDWQAMVAFADAICPREKIRDVQGRTIAV